MEEVLHVAREGLRRSFHHDVRQLVTVGPLYAIARKKE
jgi:hypothetical protein